MTAKPKAKAKPKPSTEPIVRTNKQQDWWCPLCDHSQTRLTLECRGCGAVRTGDEVIVP